MSDIRVSTNEVSKDKIFTAACDNISDDSVVIQEAIDYLQNECNGGTILLPVSQYRIENTLIIRADKSRIIFKGEGPNTDTGTKLMSYIEENDQPVVWVQGVSKSTSSVCRSQFIIQDICIFNQITEEVNSKSMGIKIGPTTGTDLVPMFMDGGYGSSVLNNLVIEHFQIGIKIYNTREVDFERISIHSKKQNSKGIFITDVEEGGFTGDLTFRNVKLTSSDAGNIGYSLSIESHISGTQIRGLHFTDCIFYFGERSINIYAENNGSIQDVWFTSCACDGPGTVRSTNAIYVESHNAKICGVQISNPYIVNYTHNGIVFTKTGDNSQLSRCSVNGGYIGLIDKEGINIYSSEYITVANVNLFNIYTTDVDTSGVITASGSSKYVIISGCAHDKGNSKAKHMIRVQDSSNNVIITGNLCACSTDTLVSIGANCTNYKESNNLKI